MITIAWIIDLIDQLISLMKEYVSKSGEVGDEGESTLAGKRIRAPHFAKKAGSRWGGVGSSLGSTSLNRGRRVFDLARELLVVRPCWKSIGKMLAA